MKTIIEMAREAGLVGGPVYARGLERFAALVRADEREACVEVVEGLFDDSNDAVLECIVDAIRARGNT